VYNNNVFYRLLNREFIIRGDTKDMKCKKCGGNVKLNIG